MVENLCLLTPDRRGVCKGNSGNASGCQSRVAQHSPTHTQMLSVSQAQSPSQFLNPGGRASINQSRRTADVICVCNVLVATVKEKDTLRLQKEHTRCTIEQRGSCVQYL